VFRPVAVTLLPLLAYVARVMTGLACAPIAVRYGGVRTAARCGATARRAAARDGALSRKRKRARLPPLTGQRGLRLERLHHGLRASLSLGPTALRPPARLPVHPAEWRRLPHPGRRVGRAQRGRPLRIYAKCIVGQDELTKRRISEAVRQS
jgi:hypothetical protein